MPKVFDKDDPELEIIYDTSLRDWESNSDEDKRAVAINLRCDHRVTVQRENQFREYFTRNVGDLKAALDDYFEDKVKKPEVPDYCQPFCENLVAECSDDSGYCCGGFDRQIVLATVMSLNGLKDALRTADERLRRGEIPIWDELRDLEITEALANHAKFGRWLDTQLEGKDRYSSEVEKIIDALFTVLAHELAQGRRYKPVVWVTDWNLFEPHATDTLPDGTLNVDRWNQVMGVNREHPTWQIVIKYAAKKVNRIYRPTQLDGGCYPQHFPSPPEALFSKGGHTADLASLDTPLFPEYIHFPIPLETDFWNQDRLIGRSKVNSYSLTRVRPAHHQKLENDYDPDHLGSIKKWMPIPI